MAYVNVATALPRSLDVQVSITKTKAELRRNLTILCLAGLDLGLLPDASRIRYYSSMDAVANDFVSTTEAYKAAQAFFSQSPRPPQMAIAQVYQAPQPAQLISASFSANELAMIAAVPNGSFNISYDIGGGSISKDFANLDFSGTTTLDQIAATIQTQAGVTLTCTVKTLPGGSKVLCLATTANGDGKTISFAATSEGGGTDISGLLKFTLETGGKALNGYTPGTIADELDNVSAAANANGAFVYGWCLDAGLRDVDTQKIAAAWSLAHTAIMPLVSNDLTAMDPGTNIDLGSVLKPTGDKRIEAIYHNDPGYYPDVSILARMLAVNYAAQDSTITAKFQSLPGIPTVPLTETQWNVLASKGYCAYTLTGNSSQVFREGGTEDSSYFLDSVINLDNFCEDLGVNLVNVFLRNGKVPYTLKGQLLLVDACQDTGRQYIFNGTFADRQVADTTSKSGYKTVPAVGVSPSPIGDATAAMRTGRIGPPITMTVQEAGAIHSIAVNVNVVS